jgi:HAD superfamily hydrolase (TIGR01509 family)
MRLNHIGIEVADCFKMELFYRKFFGFKTLYRYASIHQAGLHTVLLERPGLTFELLERQTNMNSGIVKKSIFHIALQVRDVNKEYSRLKLLGLQNLRPPRITGDGFLEFEASDPEGNIIEISKRAGPAPFYPVRAVIFDLDGTVIDSEGNYYEADRQLMESYGIVLTPGMKNKYVGTGNLEMMKDLRKTYNIADSLESMLAKKNELYINIARKGTRVFPEMIKFIEKLKKKGYSLAIASGTSPGVLEEIIGMTGLGKYFNIAVSAESVGRGKPFPDVFLEAARLLGVDPLVCAVVEDSQYGVEAARRAFMSCIAVPYITGEPLPDMFLAADLLFEKGIRSFSAEKAYKWIRRSKNAWKF